MAGRIVTLGAALATMPRPKENLTANTEQSVMQAA